jgi:hypothetical protein
VLKLPPTPVKKPTITPVKKQPVAIIKSSPLKLKAKEEVKTDKVPILAKSKDIKK